MSEHPDDELARWDRTYAHVLADQAKDRRILELEKENDNLKSAPHKCLCDCGCTQTVTNRDACECCMFGAHAAEQERVRKITRHEEEILRREAREAFLDREATIPR